MCRSRAHRIRGGRRTGSSSQRRTTDGSASQRHGPPCAGRVPAAAATAAVSAGVGPANCTSRLSCTRTARPGGGSRGASEARSPASAASSGSIAPSRKVLAATPAHRGCSRPRPPATAPTRPTERPSRSRRTSSPLRSSAAWADWASPSCSQPSTSSRIVGRSTPRGRDAAGGRGTEPPVDLVAQVRQQGCAGPGVVGPDPGADVREHVEVGEGTVCVDDVQVQGRRRTPGRGSQPQRTQGGGAPGARTAHQQPGPLACAPDERADPLQVGLVDQPHHDGTGRPRAGGEDRSHQRGQRRQPRRPRRPATDPPVSPPHRRDDGGCRNGPRGRPPSSPPRPSPRRQPPDARTRNPVSGRARAGATVAAWNGTSVPSAPRDRARPGVRRERSRQRTRRRGRRPSRPGPARGTRCATTRWPGSRH